MRKISSMLCVAAIAMGFATSSALAAAAIPGFCSSNAPTPPNPSKVGAAPTSYKASLDCTFGKKISTRTITFTNNSGDGVWMGGYGTSVLLNSASNPGNYMPAACTGFYIGGTSSGKGKNNSVTLTVPADLQSARFWPRSGCETWKIVNPYVGSAQGGPYYCAYDYLACDTGTCLAASSWQDSYDPSNPVSCYVTTGSAPESIFEVTLGNGSASDYYDLSNVDGFGASLTMNISGNYSPVTPWSGNLNFNCNGGTRQKPAVTPTPAKCVNFKPSTMCPPELQKTDASGTVIACYSIGQAAADPDQSKILGSAWKSRNNSKTDALNLKFVAAMKRAGAVGTYTTISDLVNSDGSIVASAATVLSCGCGSAATGCGFESCAAGCSDKASYNGGTCYPWPTGVTQGNNNAGSLNCSSSDTLNGNPICVANPAACFKWTGGNTTSKSSPTKDTNTYFYKMSLCDSTWWPTPDATFCAGAKTWLNGNACRYDTIFKAPCPDAYSWQFDDLSSTYQCVNADYQVTIEKTK